MGFVTLFVLPFRTGGLHGIFKNFSAHQRWIKTTSGRTKLFEKMLDVCGMINDPDCPKDGKHRDLDPAQIKKSEKAVQKVLTAISQPLLHAFLMQ